MCSVVIARGKQAPKILQSIIVIQSPTSNINYINIIIIKLCKGEVNIALPNEFWQSSTEKRKRSRTSTDSFHRQKHAVCICSTAKKIEQENRDTLTKTILFCIRSVR